MLAVLLQPLASVTVTVCVPAASPEACCVVCPFAQLKLYGAIPPAAATVAVPFDEPKQLTLKPAKFDVALAFICIGAAEPIVAVLLMVHPLASVVWIV